jgi:hypothetical protein
MSKTKERPQHGLRALTRPTQTTNNNTNYERFNRNNWMSNSKMHYYRCCWQSYGHLFPKMSLDGYFINYF